MRLSAAIRRALFTVSVLFAVLLAVTGMVVATIEIVHARPEGVDLRATWIVLAGFLTFAGLLTPCVTWEILDGSGAYDGVRTNGAPDGGPGPRS